MATRRTPLRLLFLTAALGALVAACGGGTGSGGDSTAQTGSVGLILTDGPTDRFDQVLVTITSVQLLGGPRGPATVFQGSRTVDLLQISTVGDLFAVEDVPAGDYSKIRLRVSGIELVDNDPTSPERVQVQRLPPKIDINPRGPFTVLPDRTLLLEIEIDAETSIHVVETGNGGFRFRPVVFAEIKDGVATSRLTRVFGTVGAVGDGIFELCPDGVVSVPEGMDDDPAEHRNDFRNGRCVDVQVDAETGIFDGNADPDTLDAVTTGTRLTAVGLFRRSDSVGTLSHQDDLDTGDEADDDLFDDDLVLAAVVLELGGPNALLRVPGTIAGPVGEVDNRFPFLAEPEDIGVDTGGASLPTQLQPGSRIFTPNGVELAPTDLEAGQEATVDGALALSDTEPDFLKAALVVAERDATGAERQRFSGTLQTVDPDGGAFVLNEDLPETAPTGDTTVTAGPDTDILFVEDAGSTASLIDLAELDSLVASRPGLRADVFGVLTTSGEIEASTVLVFEPAP